MENHKTRVKTAVFQQAKEGEYYCGDNYFYIETDDQFICALADGLGSGELAYESSQIVMNIIKNDIHISADQLVRRSNEQLRGKRGVVLGILKLKYQTREYTFSSIGNIGIMVVTNDGRKKRNIPHAGYLAGHYRPLKVISAKLETYMNFIMFSDGVTERNLSQQFLLHHNVDEIVRTYASYYGGVRSDDVTLIAIQFRDDK